MEKILQNEELLEKLATVETAEELEVILAENNIPLEEGVTAQQIVDVLKGENEELGEDDLDSVAGGVIITPAIIAAAAALGIGVATFIKYHYDKYKRAKRKK